MSFHRRAGIYAGALPEPVPDRFAEDLFPCLALDRRLVRGPALPASVRHILAATEARLHAARASHLGHAHNLVSTAEMPSALSHLLATNLGDPAANSDHASEIRALERYIVSWLMDLWDCDAPEAFRGTICAGSADGNLRALLLAREALPDAPLLHSREAHPSIPEAARLLRISTIVVETRPNGAIDLDAVADALAARRGAPVIVALTCGTAGKGAHDDIGGVIARLDGAGVGRDRRFIHVDGALGAMVLPFADGVEPGMRPSFGQPIDSLSVSGHKMIGTPMPCGVMVARRAHQAAVPSDAPAPAAARHGHAVLTLWARLRGHGAAGFRADVATSLARSARLAAGLGDRGVPVLRNPHSLALVFPRPGEAIMARYQLARVEGAARAVVMPNVTDALIDRFLTDYLAWWRVAPTAPVAPAALPASALAV